MERFRLADMNLTADESLFQVVEEIWNANRFDSRIEQVRELTPFFGRASVISRMNEMWSEVSCQWRRTQESETGVHTCVMGLALTGEPGIGKSRTVRHFVNQIQADQRVVPLVEVGAAAHWRSSAFAAPLAALMRFARIERTTPRRVARRKLAKLFRTVLGAIPEAVDLVLDMLPLNERSSQRPNPAQSAQRRRQRFMSLIEHCLGQLCVGAPVLLLVEDQHWLDPSSNELLNRLLGDETRLHGMLVVTVRPSAVSTVVAETQFTQMSIPALPSGLDIVELKALSAVDGAALAQNILRDAMDAGIINAPLVARIAARGQGNPLFLEELSLAVRSGFDSTSEVMPAAQVPTSEIATLVDRFVPDSLHDSLLSRLDQVHEGRRLLQLAAVIGTQFNFELFASLTGLSVHATAQALERLVESELLLRRGQPPHSTYRFKHALLQDASYSTLLRATRAEMHLAVATALETHFREIVRSEPELLAHHLAQGGKIADALEFWRKAAASAVQGSAYQEAIAHLESACASLESLHDEFQRSRWKLTLLTDMGPALLATRGYAAIEVSQLYANAAELLREQPDAPERGSVLRGQRTFALLRAEYARAHDFGRDLLLYARRTRSKEFRLEAHLGLGLCDLFMAKFQRATRHFQRVIRIYFDAEQGTQTQRFGTDSGASALSYCGRAEWFLGDTESSLSKAEQAVALTERLGHPFSRAQALCMLANIHQLRQEPTRTEDIASQAVQVSAEQGFPYWNALANILLGWARALNSSPEEGLEILDDGLRRYERSGARLGTSWFQCLRAEVLRVSGHSDDASTCLVAAKRIIAETGERYHSVDLHVLQCKIAYDLGDLERADAEARYALDLARVQQSPALELRALLAGCELYLSPTSDAMTPWMRQLQGFVGQAEGFTDSLEFLRAQELLQPSPE